MKSATYSSTSSATNLFVCMRLRRAHGLGYWLSRLWQARRTQAMS